MSDCCQRAHLGFPPPFLETVRSLSVSSLAPGSVWPCEDHPVPDLYHSLPYSNLGCRFAVPILSEVSTSVPCCVQYPCSLLGEFVDVPVSVGMNIYTYCRDNFCGGVLHFPSLKNVAPVVRLPDPFLGGPYVFCDRWSQCTSTCFSKGNQYPLNHHVSPPHAYILSSPTVSCPNSVLSLQVMSRLSCGEFRLVEGDGATSLPSCLSLVTYVHLNFDYASL